MATQTVRTQAEIDEIRERVTGMYSKHPWPSTREADEEMGWRLRMLGIRKSDYEGKKVVELGCGTGEYSLWYATHGAADMTGVDLSKGSLALAEQKRTSGDVQNVRFLEKDILKLDLPDNTYDYAYSVGVLHHTGDTYKGFQHLCRIAKPGGVVVVSLYNSYSCFTLRVKQAICRLLGGKDLDKRARIGRKLFPFTMYSMNKRYHETNYELISYDIFAFPHATFHTGAEVLKWFDANNIEYTGSFAPLRFRDYFYAYSLPEYQSFKRTFSGFPLIRLFSWTMNKISTLLFRTRPDEHKTFPRPSWLSMFLVQMVWVCVGIRLNCFTIAGRKRA
ncbi:MAG: class I SAM-dependent methyltransferase [Acidobacteria bacterium]|nr:class I SAM-dependent methyltransferase [Acidobacteriota bacterium]